MIPNIQEGDISFGQVYMLGTAGDKDSDFASAQEIMYNPRGYNMYALPNVYDADNSGKHTFVYFFPGYLNRKGCYNKDGVSDVTKALKQILMNRHKVKYNSSDPNTIIKTIAEVPITPAEAILKVGKNMFPVTDLAARLGQIDSNPSEYSDVYCGILDLESDGKVRFKPTSDEPIRKFPHKNNKNMYGAVEIFQMPEKDSEGKVFSNRYIAGSDPYDDDESESVSLGSTFVLDLWTDKIVAEYTGRPNFAEDYYEITRRLCMLFNAKLNYENNKKGLFAYFSKMTCTHLLTDTLDFLKDKLLAKDGIGNKSKGVQATLPVNKYARELIDAWLRKPVTINEANNGEEGKETTLPNLFFLRNRALIQELMSWNAQGNFDRVSSLGMLMLLREDKLILNGGTGYKRYDSTKYLGNDKFFSSFDDMLAQ